MFADGSWASIWEIRAGKGNYREGRISTSHKRKDNGSYETDFSGFVRFVGTASDKVAQYEGQQSDHGPIARVKLERVGISNTYDKDKKVTYWNPVVFDLSEGDSNGGSRSSGGKDDWMNVPAGSDDALPFN